MRWAVNRYYELNKEKGLDQEWSLKIGSRKRNWRKNETEKAQKDNFQNCISAFGVERTYHSEMNSCDEYWKVAVMSWPPWMPDWDIPPVGHRTGKAF